MHLCLGMADQQNTEKYTIQKHITSNTKKIHYNVIHINQ